MFIIYKNLPYYLSDDKKYVYPCRIDAFSVSVDFNSRLNAPKNINYTLTDNEIRAKLNIVPIDSWDNQNNKVIKVTNKVASSIRNKKSE